MRVLYDGDDVVDYLVNPFLPQTEKASEKAVEAITPDIETPDLTSATESQQAERRAQEEARRKQAFEASQRSGRRSTLLNPPSAQPGLRDIGRKTLLGSTG